MTDGRYSMRTVVKELSLRSSKTFSSLAAVNFVLLARRSPLSTSPIVKASSLCFDKTRRQRYIFTLLRSVQASFSIVRYSLICVQLKGRAGDLRPSQRKGISVLMSILSTLNVPIHSPDFE